MLGGGGEGLCGRLRHRGSVFDVDGEDDDGLSTSSIKQLMIAT